MKALILAAGLGTRLKPLTDEMPKALIPIAGKPLLEHIILKLKFYGINDIIINIHHFGEQIISFIKQNNGFGLSVEFSDERDCLLNTGGAIKKAISYFDEKEPFLVHNVDILSNVDLNDLFENHKNNGSLVTLFVNQRSSTRYLLFNKNEKLCGWKNEKTGEIRSGVSGLNESLCGKYAFNGIHVISPAIFNFMESWKGAFSIIDFYLSVMNRIPIKAYNPQNVNVMDVGKIEFLDEAQLFLKKNSIG